MSALNHYQTLVLNADYTPLSLSPLKLMNWEQAAFSVVTNKYIVVSEYDRVVRSSPRNSKGTSTEFFLPSVVALKKFQNLNKPAVFSRHNIYARDSWTCQYCRNKFRPHELTFDHLTPQSRGGKTTWTNIVTACTTCNSRKADKSLKEFGIPLLKVPTVPTKAVLNEIVRRNPPIFSHLHESWIPFLGIEKIPEETRITKGATSGMVFPCGMTDADYWNVELQK